MRRVRTVIVSVLLIALQVSGLASASMGSCLHHGNQHAMHSNGEAIADPIDHRHHQQHQNKTEHSACKTGCTCVGLCAGGLALVYQPQTFSYAMSRDWSNFSPLHASLSKPISPFRPPIAAA